MILTIYKESLSEFFSQRGSPGCLNSRAHVGRHYLQTFPEKQQAFDLPPAYTFGPCQAASPSFVVSVTHLDRSALHPFGEASALVGFWRFHEREARTDSRSKKSVDGKAPGGGNLCH